MRKSTAPAPQNGVVYQSQLLKLYKIANGGITQLMEFKRQITRLKCNYITLNCNIRLHNYVSPMLALL